MNKQQESKTKKEQEILSGRGVLWRGICGRCPNCGKEKIFKGYLTQVERCSSCKADIGNLKADDGPAWLTILVTGHIVAPFFAFFALNETAPQWLMMTVLCVLIIILVFLLLPRCKGLFIAALWLIKNNRA